MTKLLDLLLITMAGLSLYVTTHKLSQAYFNQANAWIPDVFMEVVQWHPSSTFHLVVSALLVAWFLARFAALPALVGALIGAVLVAIDILPMVSAQGLETVIKYLLNNHTMALDIIKPVIILPLICYILWRLKRPNREKEVIDTDD